MQCRHRTPERPVATARCTTAGACGRTAVPLVATAGSPWSQDEGSRAAVDPGSRSLPPPSSARGSRLTRPSRARRPVLSRRRRTSRPGRPARCPRRSTRRMRTWTSASRQPSRASLQLGHDRRLRGLVLLGRQQRPVAHVREALETVEQRLRALRERRLGWVTRARARCVGGPARTQVRDPAASAIAVPITAPKSARSPAAPRGSPAGVAGRRTARAGAPRPR